MPGQEPQADQVESLSDDQIRVALAFPNALREKGHPRRRTLNHSIFKERQRLGVLLAHRALESPWVQVTIERTTRIDQELNFLILKEPLMFDCGVPQSGRVVTQFI
jgi:hypothetical protein